MEFGEKLKSVREEKGITQQTLADTLFVTRQAVSRWECGARYPDLMTTKKICDYFEITMDELVSGDDWKSFPEKQTLIESGRFGKVQAIIYAMGCMLAVLKILYFVYYIPGFLEEYAPFQNGISKMGFMEVFGIVELLVLIFTGGLFWYGVSCSLKREMGVKLACGIIELYLASNAFQHILLLVLNGGILLRQQETRILLLYDIGFLVADILFMIYIYLYFTKANWYQAKIIYVIGGLMSIHALYSLVKLLIESQVSWEDAGWDAVLIARNYKTLDFFYMIIIMILICYQATIVSRKRRLSRERI